MPPLTEFIAKVKAKGGTAHVLGLMSPGGVHSHQSQIAALCRILADAGLKVAVHAVLDGRDTPPQSALGYLKRFMADTEGAGHIKIATISGRYYAMDRDKRWDRVEKAYLMLTEAVGHRAPIRWRRSRRPTRAARPTNSCCRPRSTTTPA
jgi:2,3-bisphosphoglycerate-independent phosphoglycerate mutase